MGRVITEEPSWRVFYLYQNCERTSAQFVFQSIGSLLRRNRGRGKNVEWLDVTILKNIRLCDYGSTSF